MRDNKLAIIIDGYGIRIDLTWFEIGRISVALFFCIIAIYSAYWLIK